MDEIQINLAEVDIDENSDDCQVAAWGEIYLTIGKTSFPFENWTDVVSSVLDMWTENIIDFVRKKKTQCTLFFMDGPYNVRVYARKNNYITLICRDDYGNVFVRSVVELATFLEKILICTSSFIDVCKHTAPNYYAMNYTCQKLTSACSVLQSLVHELR